MSPQSEDLPIYQGIGKECRYIRVSSKIRELNPAPYLVAGIFVGYRLRTANNLAEALSLFHVECEGG